MSGEMKKIPSEWWMKPVVLKRLNDVQPRTISKKENLISANSEMIWTIPTFHACPHANFLVQSYINYKIFFKVRQS